MFKNSAQETALIAIFLFYGSIQHLITQHKHLVKSILHILLFLREPLCDIFRVISQNNIHAYRRLKKLEFYEVLATHSEVGSTCSLESRHDFHDNVLLVDPPLIGEFRVRCKTLQRPFTRAYLFCGSFNHRIFTTNVIGRNRNVRCL